ncbi:MAG: CTP-dependent riboflavin kinase [Thermoplasmata archaeon]|nr:CTP-dependent riboflavin kinase [Thermoplasmata archaeon]
MRNDKVVIPLRALALRGALWSPVRIKTSELGSTMGMSQQGASQVLKRLERAGYIERWKGAGGSLIHITPKGRDLLLEFYHTLKMLFTKGGEVRLKGRVVRGMGEGRYYLSLKPYSEAIKKLTETEVYPGTLNIALDGLSAIKFRALSSFPGMEIMPFKAEGRSFGGAKLFRARIGDEQVHVIIPQRTHYQDVVEVISEKSLREALDLSDGSVVEVVVEVNIPGIGDRD